MESHILNVYHQTPYRGIGHKIMRSTSESVSSESSCNQNSPEYTMSQKTSQYEEESNEGEFWNRRDSHHGWTNNQNVNITQTNIDTSIDDENIEISLDFIDDNNSESDDYETTLQNMHDSSLVEGHDYEVIQVIAVDPHLDLEASSDEEEVEDDNINEDDQESEDGENIVYEHEIPGHTHNISQDSLGINFDSLVVSNVDEYFIKHNENNLIEVKNEHVVNDIDEYFIKETKELEPPNVDDYFIKEKLPEESNFRISKTVPNPLEVFDTNSTNLVKEQQNNEIGETEDNVAEVSINESDLEVLPNMEDLKRFLLEDMPYNKLKNAQKTYSVSLPHSPMHNLCLDIDAKTCLSFEDLNLDLSDISFENEKEKFSTNIKIEDVPRTLTEEDVNSFLITDKTRSKEVVKNEDNFNLQDMDMDRPVDAIIDIDPVSHFRVNDRKFTSTPIPAPNVLDYCIEKTSVKKEPDIKLEVDDFVDVESCPDTVVPVLEANNLHSLLEQFEATEKLNKKDRKPIDNVEAPKANSYNLTSGMRLQDAGIQLNKTKMKKIMMPSKVNTVIRKPPSPLHSDHDYCSPKKRHSFPNSKGGRSLLKPEVLSSNSRILNSRHRSCKNKKVVYHLSSDDETECNDKKKIKLDSNRIRNESDIKTNKRSCIKASVKPPVNTTSVNTTSVNTSSVNTSFVNTSSVNSHKKISHAHSVSKDSGLTKNNDSVIVKNASKAASDNSISQNSNNCSIKLTIKNKSEVIIQNCDARDLNKNSSSEKSKSSKAYSSSNKLLTNVNNIVKSVEPLDRVKNKNENCDKKETLKIKQDVTPKQEHFYTALFSNKQDVRVPKIIDAKSEIKRKHEVNKVIVDVPVINNIEQPSKKKKLNLKEYKQRRGLNSNNGSAQVSPESIFPEMPCNLNLDKTFKMADVGTSNNVLRPKENIKTDVPKIVFDPIREASRKILMNSKIQKAKASRKSYEDIVMSKIPKVESFELQPLISDAEMMKIVGMTPSVLPVPIAVPIPREQPKEYDEIILVSIGTNTDESLLKNAEKDTFSKKRKVESPQTENKSIINFKIKKSDPVLKQNVFESLKNQKSQIDDKNRSDIKIDKERLKDITATLKSVEMQVETKISSNSLFASIQDLVMKKAPIAANSNSDHKSSKPNSPVERREFKYPKPTIVREYNNVAEHGEDKVILHLEKNRKKPDCVTTCIQTDATVEFVDLPKIRDTVTRKPLSVTPRKRNDSDMSMSSDDSPVRPKRIQNVPSTKSDEKVAVVKSRTETRRQTEQSHCKEKRSRSRNRYDVKYRRSRSHSRGHRRKRSPSRNRSRSRGRYRRYRRSDSPYRRKRRSRTRSPYRSTRRSPSVRRDHRSNRSRSRSKHTDQNKSRSPLPKQRPSPQYIVNNTEKKTAKSLTPPLRNPTVSESSETSSSSSSSSASSSSRSTASSKTRASCSPYQKDDTYRAKSYRSSYSSEDRESNTPVEERRIVFVGRLEKDITKIALKAQFVKFGPVTEVRLHSKEDGSRYGFVTFQRPRDAWSAVEAAGTFPQYDVGFGGRRAFCRQSYADLDGLEAKYTESAFHGQASLPIRRNDDMSFEQMLLDMKKTLNKRKGDKNRSDDTSA